MKKLIAIDKGLEKVVNILATISMALILFVTFIQVVARQFKFSISGYEELPMYMMLITVWLTASMLVKNKGNIAISLVSVFIKDEKKLKMVDVFNSIIATICFLVFTFFSFDFAKYNYVSAFVTPGLKIPYWILVLVMAFSSLIMTVYYFVDSINEIKEVMSWK